MATIDDIYGPDDDTSVETVATETAESPDETAETPTTEILSETAETEKVATETETVESRAEASTPDATAVADAVRKAVPGVALTDTTPDGIAAAFRDQYDTASGYADALNVVADAKDKLPGVDAFVREAALSGDPVKAFLAAFPDLEKAFDPEEGSREWDTLRERRIRDEERSKYEGRETQQKADQQARWEQDSVRAAEAFEQALPDGIAEADVPKFWEFVGSLLSPNQTGRFRGDTIYQYAKAYTYDADVAKAKASGETAGYERALAEMKAKGINRDGTLSAAAKRAVSDGVPFTGSGGGNGRVQRSGVVQTQATMDDLYGPN